MFEIRMFVKFRQAQLHTNGKYTINYDLSSS